MEDLKQLLDSVEEAKRKPLVSILDTTYTPTSSSEDIIKGLKWLNRSLLEDFWRDVFGEQETYQELLLSICEHLKAEPIPNLDYLKIKEILKSKDEASQHIKQLLTPARLEQLIGQKFLRATWDKMTSDQRKVFEAEVAKVAEKHGKGAEWASAGGMAAVLAAAKLGGFSTYLVATTGLATVTGTLGITIPFAAYAGLTSAISVAIGPVGWLGLALFTLLGISGANYKKLIPAVLYIAMLRNEQNLETNGQLPAAQAIS